MSDSSKNPIIRLLQEMRAETRQGFKEVNTRMEGVNARLADMNLRRDGITLILTTLAGRIHQHDDRLEALEGRVDE